MCTYKHQTIVITCSLLTFQKLWLENQFKELNNKIDMLMASGIARTLQPLLTPSSAPSASHLPVMNMSTPVTPGHLLTPLSATSSSHLPVISMGTPATTSLLTSGSNMPTTTLGLCFYYVFCNLVKLVDSMYYLLCS